MPEAREISVRRLVRVPGGASRVTWSCDARWLADGERQERGLILRLDPEASLLTSNRATEFRIYQALAGSGVPVPRVLWDEPDPAWLGHPFFVMERLPGETAPSVLMTERWAPVHERIGQQLAAHLARIHALDWRALGLDFLGLPASPATCPAREIARWEETLRRDEAEPQPVLNLALRWLKAHQPDPRRVALVHGDYRTGNYLYDDDGIRAFLDWEMAHLGDPMEDLGWTVLRYWRFAGDDRAGGVIDRETLFRLYEAAGGDPVDREAVHFWEVLGNVKMAVISLTGARSFTDRRSRDLVMAYVGRGLPRLEAELLDLLGR
jgi:aminoglycoside phosphotransferase (APT) family kinase protein